MHLEIAPGVSVLEKKWTVQVRKCQGQMLGRTQIVVVDGEQHCVFVPSASMVEDSDCRKFVVYEFVWQLWAGRRWRQFLEMVLAVVMQIQEVEGWRQQKVLWLE